MLSLPQPEAHEIAAAQGESAKQLPSSAEQRTCRHAKIAPGLVSTVVTVSLPTGTSCPTGTSEATGTSLTPGASAPAGVSESTVPSPATVPSLATVLSLPVVASPVPPASVAAAPLHSETFFVAEPASGVVATQASPAKHAAIGCHENLVGSVALGVHFTRVQMPPALEQPSPAVVGIQTVPGAPPAVAAPEPPEPPPPTAAPQPATKRPAANRMAKLREKMDEAAMVGRIRSDTGPHAGGNGLGRRFRWLHREGRSGQLSLFLILASVYAASRVP